MKKATKKQMYAIKQRAELRQKYKNEFDKIQPGERRMFLANQVQILNAEIKEFRDTYGVTNSEILFY